jgi:hypothetical protein
MALTNGISFKLLSEEKSKSEAVLNVRFVWCLEFKECLEITSIYANRVLSAFLKCADGVKYSLKIND